MNIPEFIKAVVEASQVYNERVSKAHQEFREIVLAAIGDVTGQDAERYLETVDKPKAEKASY